MKIEQSIAFRPALNHCVAPRHDGITQDDVDFVASSENEIRAEGNIRSRRTFVHNRTDWVSQIRCAHRFFGADAEGESDRPDLDLVPGLERSPTGNAIPVDRSPTLATKVLNVPGFAFKKNPAMPSRYFGMVQNQVSLRRAANHDIFGAQQLRTWWEPGKNGDWRFQS